MLILPNLGYKELFLKFRLDEPWDSDHNKALMSLMPAEYAAPDEAFVGRDEFTTFCQVLVGPETAFSCPGGCRIAEDFISLSNTIILVEAATAVPWTKPQDVTYVPDQHLPRFGAFASKTNPSLFFDVTNTFCIAWGDSRATHVLIEDQTKAESALRAAFTRDGKEIGKWYWR